MSVMKRPRELLTVHATDVDHNTPKLNSGWFGVGGPRVYQVIVRPPNK